MLFICLFIQSIFSFYFRVVVVVVVVVDGGGSDGGVASYLHYILYMYLSNYMISSTQTQARLFARSIAHTNMATSTLLLFYIRSTHTHTHTLYFDLFNFLFFFFLLLSFVFFFFFYFLYSTAAPQ